MMEKSTENENPGKRGNNPDPLSLENIPEIPRKTGRKVLPPGMIRVYPVQEIRKGRPRYYLMWRENGKLRKHYLGNTLPREYKLNTPVEIDQTSIRSDRGKNP